MKDDMKLIRSVIDNCKKIFPVTAYVFECLPTSTAGQFGLVLASKNEVCSETSIGLGDKVY